MDNLKTVKYQVKVPTATLMGMFMLVFGCLGLNMGAVIITTSATEVRWKGNGIRGSLFKEPGLFQTAIFLKVAFSKASRLGQVAGQSRKGPRSFSESTCSIRTRR